LIVDDKQKGIVPLLSFTRIKINNQPETNNNNADSEGNSTGALWTTTQWHRGPLSSAKERERRRTIVENKQTKKHRFPYNLSGTEFMRPK
jgi:hypothetical protein